MISFDRRRAGFTLIEVLVVVSIIALLIAIMMPSLKQAREQARVSVCLSNLGTLGKASLAYINCERNRFCFSAPPPLTWDAANQGPFINSYFFGGNRGQDSVKLGTIIEGRWVAYIEDGDGDLGPDQRPLNKYVYNTAKFGSDHRPLHQAGPLRAYECPSDKGSRLDQITASFLHENIPCYLETGTSFDENLQWWFYVDNEGLAGAARTQRMFHVMDRFVPIMSKKGPSRAILLYEDAADFSLATGLMTSGGFPPGFKVRGWHFKYDLFNMLFLDGHAAAVPVDWSKNLPHGPANVSGTAMWVSHQEAGDN